MDKLYNLIDSQKEYLHPATPHPNYSCIVCRGTKRDDFARCPKCGKDFRDAQWPDLLGFGVFARADEQSGTLMHRYKKSAPVRTSRQDKSIVGSLAAAAMHQAYNQLPTLDVTTTVPSTRGRESHPLHDLVLRAADYLPEPIQVKQLLQTNLETNPPTREVNSDLFTVIGNVEAQHITQRRRSPHNSNSTSSLDLKRRQLWTVCRHELRQEKPATIRRLRLFRRTTQN